MYYRLENFDVDYLEVDSASLRENPLNDPSLRISPVLVPREKTGPLPVVYVLAGFSGNSPFYLNQKFGSKNFAETLDFARGQSEAPAALYVLIDALTAVGGSQFIDSAGCGKYESYIVKDLLPELGQKFELNSELVAVVGGSSGGYGALSLSSRFPQLFPWAAAIAPDSCFEHSLLPEVVKTIGKIDRLGGAMSIRQMIETGELFERRDWHDILNVIGMGFCYSEIRDGEPIWPLNVETAEPNEQWQRWLECDPVNFLRNRVGELKSLKGIFLEVGRRDQFQLHFGARRIHKMLEDQGVTHSYGEFDGTHFDIGSRRVEIWKWLQKEWQSPLET